MIVQLACSRGHLFDFLGPINDLNELTCPECAEKKLASVVSADVESAMFIEKLKLYLVGMGREKFPVRIGHRDGIYTVANKICPQFNHSGKDLITVFQQMSVPVAAISQFEAIELKEFIYLGRQVYKAAFLAIVGVDVEGFESSSPIVFGDQITANFGAWRGSDLEKQALDLQLATTYALAKQAAKRKKGSMWTILLAPVLHWQSS